MGFYLNKELVRNYSNIMDPYGNYGLSSDEVSTGTSIMAVEFDRGVVIAADSRTTSGPYIANRVTDKLTPIHDHIYCCRSGSAADTQAIADIVAANVELDGVQMGELPSVKKAAEIFRSYCYNYRDSLSAGIIVAGWDPKKGGQVYTIPLGGMLVRQPFSIGGSGSTYIYGHVDKQFKEDMSREECVLFCKEALALAMNRDGSSGGVIRLAIIDNEGVERRVFLGDEIPKFYEG